jgi:hypothetical protein
MQHDRNRRELAATFEAATEFGLSDEQVWETARAVADRVPASAQMSDWFDDLVEALAAQIAETVLRSATRSFRSESYLGLPFVLQKTFGHCNGLPLPKALLPPPSMTCGPTTMPKAPFWFAVLCPTMLPSP